MNVTKDFDEKKRETQWNHRFKVTENEFQFKHEIWNVESPSKSRSNPLVISSGHEVLCRVVIE